MSIQQGTTLFADLSSEASSQTKGGGGWYSPYSRTSRITVRVRYYPAAAVDTGSAARTINITNPEFDDGSIINLGGGGAGINITNPDIDDGASLAF